MIIFTYVVLFFLVIRFSVTVFNFLSNPKLPSFGPAFTDLVSVVITVRNEESNLLNLLKSILAQEYRNIEVIIYHSALDRNDVHLVEAVCKEDPRFRLVKGLAGDYSWVEGFRRRLRPCWKQGNSIIIICRAIAWRSCWPVYLFILSTMINRLYGALHFMLDYYRIKVIFVR